MVYKSNFDDEDFQVKSANSYSRSQLKELLEKIELQKNSLMADFDWDGESKENIDQAEEYIERKKKQTTWIHHRLAQLNSINQRLAQLNSQVVKLIQGKSEIKFVRMQEFNRYFAFLIREELGIVRFKELCQKAQEMTQKSLTSKGLKDLAEMDPSIAGESTYGEEDEEEWECG